MDCCQPDTNQKTTGPKTNQPSLMVFVSGVVLGGLIGALLVYNAPNMKNQRTSSPKPADLTDTETAAAYLRFKEIKSSFIPTGIPDVYGEELKISFDAVQEAIDTVAPFDPTYGPEGKKIALTGFTASELERYKKIGSSIACEFCCGVTTLVLDNGEAACGCDHSQMMRGLIAYLIKSHPEISDEQILGELKKWKITYFPKQTLTQELDRRQKAGESGIKEILAEFPDFLPQMVGGC